MEAVEAVAAEAEEAAAPAAKEKVAPAAVGTHQAAGYRAAAVVPPVKGWRGVELLAVAQRVVKVKVEASTVRASTVRAVVLPALASSVAAVAAAVVAVAARQLGCRGRAAPRVVVASAVHAAGTVDVAAATEALPPPRSRRGHLRLATTAGCTCT